MTAHEPPRIAQFLLRHFGCSPNNQAIIGDLNEKYEGGQSRLWYWQQAIGAMVAGLWNEVRSHRLLTLSGVVSGWLSLLLLMRLIEPVYLSLHKNDYLPMLYERMPANWFTATEVWSYIGRIMQPFDWLIVSFGCLVSACSGSLVAFLHRKKSRATLLAFFVSRCIVVFPLICFLLLGVIYMPQYGTAFLKLIVGNLLVLMAIVIPGAFITNLPQSHLQNKSRG
jgi:hypothetical protein